MANFQFEVKVPENMAESFGEFYENYGDHYLCSIIREKEVTTRMIYNPTEDPNSPSYIQKDV